MPVGGSKFVNRLIVAGAATLAGALIAAPAVIGLRGNSSFTRDIPVPVPSGAHPAVFSEPEPSGGRTTVDDRPGHDAVTHGATDDHGGRRHDADAGTGSTDDAGLPGDRHDDDRTGHRGSDDPRGDRHRGRGDG